MSHAQSAEAPWTVRRLLEWTSAFFTRRGIDSPRLSAELLLSHVLSAPRIKLYTDYDRELPPEALKRYRGLVERAAAHEPIAYLTGTAHFFNLEIHVTRDTLIPRPDTETLVEQAVKICRAQAGLESPRIVDLCTGSGCVAAALAASLKAAFIVATDISAAALEVARGNFGRLRFSERVELLQGDLLAPLERLVDARPFDLIVSNPPYIPTGQLESLDASVRDHEPRLALDGGIDGLVLHRRILADAPLRLAPGGHLLMEIAFDQAAAAMDAAAAHSARFDEAKILKDAAGHDRVLSVRRK